MAIETAIQDAATLINTKTEWGKNPLPKNTVQFLDRQEEEYSNQQREQASIQTGAKRKTMATRYGGQAIQAVEKSREPQQGVDMFKQQYKQRKRRRKALEDQPLAPEAPEMVQWGGKEARRHGGWRTPGANPSQPELAQGQSSARFHARRIPDRTEVASRANRPNERDQYGAELSPE